MSHDGLHSRYVFAASCVQQQQKPQHKQATASVHFGLATDQVRVARFFVAAHTQKGGCADRAWACALINLGLSLNLRLNPV